MMQGATAAVELVFREEYGRLIASLVRRFGDIDLAQEAAGQALVAALEKWPESGVPPNPGGWLFTTAGHRAIDWIRREKQRDAKHQAALMSYDDTPHEPTGPVEDDRLRLLFTCCHPALAPEARIALTLRLICGLTTEEIARAFLVPEPTMAARITRSKKKIATAGIPYRVPAVEDLPERLDGVLTVIHLVFTTGYAGGGELLVRADLVERALDLARVLAVLMPREPEALGLLALLELTDARRAARVDAAGRLVVLEDQDRSCWDAAAITRGEDLLARAFTTSLRSGSSPGRFLLQAAIAGAHDEAASWAATDWGGIVMLYDRLLAVWPSPVVEVNRAVAVAFASGPEDGLALLDGLAGLDELRSWHYLPASRADLLRRLGRDAEAARAYREALALVSDGAEREFLEQRLAQVDPDGSAD